MIEREIVREWTQMKNASFVFQQVVYLAFYNRTIKAMILWMQK